MNCFGVITVFKNWESRHKGHDGCDIVEISNRPLGNYSLDIFDFGSSSTSIIIVLDSSSSELSDDITISFD